MDDRRGDVSSLLQTLRVRTPSEVHQSVIASLHCSFGTSVVRVMARIHNALLSYFYDVPENSRSWLVGRDADCILNAVPCSEAFEEFSKPLLPGGLFVVGVFLACETPADMTELWARVKLARCLLVVRSQSVCRAYLATSDTCDQVDLAVEDPPVLSILHSKTNLVLNSLESLELFASVNKSVTFEVAGVMVPLSEPTELAWNGVVKKQSKQKSVSIEAGIWYAATAPYGEPYDSPALSISRGTALYDLQIDWATVFFLSEPVGDVLESHLYKLKEIADYMIDRLKERPQMQMACYAFQNAYCPHPFHGIYYLDAEAFALGDAAELMKSQRKHLHETFRLPMDWPLARPICAMTVRADTDTKIVDLHEPLMATTQNDVGVKYAVKGHYVYYHYNQDSFDDRGWGCAYRSLQTIWSWFREQHYTTSEVPSHYLIQKMLVDAEDKPKEFLGSREWIGSFEISICLDLHLGVQSKILSVKSGSELAEKGRELASHFADQGTPVMIGGGVLAYTLLGVDYDDVTGAVRFLILDPHYTGADNPKTVLDKGFCAWKTVELFKKDAFYNLCMPQRPSYF